MACKMVLIREVGPYQQLKRCELHGIAIVEDRSTGIAHSAHPNIHRTGSVAGMKRQGGWTQDAVTVRCHGYIYNASVLIATDDEDRIADEACQCSGHRAWREQHQPSVTLSITLDELLDLILYGDVSEEPWSILGDRIDQSQADLNQAGLDVEQRVRTDIAATIAARWKSERS